MLTVLDIIHLIQYYYRTTTYAHAATDVEKFRLESLRGNSIRSLLVPQSYILSSQLDIEKELGVAQPPLLYEHPSSTLYDCAKLLIQSHARRLPLLDSDTETGHEVIVSVLTQYRLLKFISINVRIDCSACCQRLIFFSVTRKYNIFSSRYGNSRSEPMSPLHQPHKFRQGRIHIIPLLQQAWTRPFLTLCICFPNAPYLLFPSSTKTALL